MKIHRGRFSSFPPTARVGRERILIVYSESSPSVRGNTSVFRSVERRHACERVLRYVDGKERRIRYPCDAEEDGAIVCTKPRCSSSVETREKDTKEGALCVEDGLLSPEQAVSPLDFLRHVTSKEYQAQQENEYERVKDAFYVAADGCPWPVPRPVYTIVVSDEKNAMYTLRTRMYQNGVESELHSLLFSKRGKHVIRCSSLVDGLVMFQSEAAAVEFGEMLDLSSLGKTIRIAEHDSHSIFRDIVEVKAVAVVVKEGCDVPDPQKLKAVLLDSSTGGSLHP